jgi:hypothetical protein
MQTNEGYRSWYEALGTSGCTVYTHFCGQYSNVDAIRPGDAMSAEVYWETTTSVCFFVTDWTRSSGNWSVCTPVSIPYDHTSAEWVNENHLPTYYYDSPGTVSWTEQLLTGSFDNSGAWSSPFSGSFEALIMDTGQGTTGTACGEPGVLSLPAGATTTTGGEGSSQIVTCSVPGYDSP